MCKVYIDMFKCLKNVIGELLRCKGNLFNVSRAKSDQNDSADFLMASEIDLIQDASGF